MCRESKRKRRAVASGAAPPSPERGELQTISMQREEATPLVEKAPQVGEIHPAVIEEHHRESRWDKLRHLFEKHVPGGGIGKYMLVPYPSLPEWLQDNHDIHTGYRVKFSVQMCFQSIFRVHNETGNIWSHFLGFLLFFLILFIDLKPVFDAKADFGDWFVFTVYMISAKTCLLFSAIFHTFYCHSQEVHLSLVRLDYAGISLLIAGSFFPPIYYGFYCTPIWQWVYLTGVAVLGITITAVSFHPTYSKASWRTFRACLYAGFGAVGVIPLLHFMLSPDSDPVGTLFPVEKFLWMGALYITGAIVYATRFPECIFPGKFDIWFHSHQIFHILVVIAASAHYFGCLDAYHWNGLRSCSA